MQFVAKKEAITPASAPAPSQLQIFQFQLTLLLETVRIASVETLLKLQVSNEANLIR